MAVAHRIYLASSNPGKGREYGELAAGEIFLELIPNFDALREFEEDGMSFAENAVGKAIHYSRMATGPVLADDSGLVVPALGGAPGIYSARYAGANATSEQRNAKLLAEMRELEGGRREARFVCVLALAESGTVNAVVSASVEGLITERPRGQGGFGYDPVFLLPALGRTFGELSRDEKNHRSHRGRAFRKLLAVLKGCETAGLLSLESAT